MTKTGTTVAGRAPAGFRFVALIGALLACLYSVGVAVLAPAALADTAPPNPALPATVSADALPTVQINGVVWSQVTVGNTVYAGGQFTKARPAGSAVGVNETARNNLLAYDITTGNLITSFAPFVNATVFVTALSPDKSVLYIGGDFTTVAGVARNHIAAINTATGALLPFAPSVNARVKAITATSSTVYFGGQFTAVNGSARTRLAAATSAGALLSWAPTADDNDVSTMVMSPDNSRVIVGGKFSTLNHTAAKGSGSLNATTGAILPWAVNSVVQNWSNNDGITSLRTDGTLIYGNGYVFGGSGNLEGTFAADPNTGAIKWIEDCHGDSYDNFPVGQVVYVVSHSHYCGNIGAFPEKGQFYHATAFTNFPTGIIAHNAINSSVTYHDWFGQPAPTQLDWYPSLANGTFTGQNQAAWSLTGNATYVSLGGEFPTVNGGAQQGLVRFAVKSAAPNTNGPKTSALLIPHLTTPSSTSVHVGWQATWDADNQALTYKVSKDGKSIASPIFTTTVNSTFWLRPSIGFTDTGNAPGSKHTYRVFVYDPSGNVQSGSTVSMTEPTASPATSTYAQTVTSDGASDLYRLDESGGTTGSDSVGYNDLVEAAGVAHAAAGALSGDTDTASTFSGDSTGAAIQTGTSNAPNTFSLEAWFKTTSTKGGEIIGFGDGTDSATGISKLADRVVYLDNAGHVRFGVVNTSLAKKLISTSGTYNNGAWHHVVASMSSSGTALYLDGALIGTDSTVTSGLAYPGYWHIGGDAFTGWTSQPTSQFLAATIDEVAIYPAALTVAQVSSHYTVGKSGVPTNVAPTAAFSTACSGLTCTFDATSSTDSDGTIAGYAWNFGDGATGTGKTVTHTYASGVPPTETVSLVVTDNQSAASQPATHTVMVPNTPPAANIATPSCTNLSCSFDGSASTDPDGTISTYVWNFGDGSTDSNVSPTHGYAAGGTYPVTLTVTDNGGATTVATTSVTVSAPANTPPTAAFTFACTGLTCSFDGSTSTDDGPTLTYAWGYGDGSPLDTTSGVVASHTYAAAGAPTVTLTVTDNGGLTDAMSQPVNPSIPVTQPLASDAFGRTVTGGWGTADKGGAWSTLGTAANLAVTAGSAAMAMPTAGTQIGAYLPGVSSTSAESDVTLSVDKSVNTYAFARVVGRRLNSTTEYRARVRFVGSKVLVSITSVVSNTETLLGTETTLAGSYPPGTLVNVRFQVTGTNPTTLRLKAWAATATEPTDWTVTATDSSAALQVAGTVGLVSYLSGTAPVAGVLPVTIKAQNYQVLPLP